LGDKNRHQACNYLTLTTHNRSSLSDLWKRGVTWSVFWKYRQQQQQQQQLESVFFVINTSKYQSFKDILSGKLWERYFEFLLVVLT